MTVATSVVAAVILFIATGNPSSWLAVLAAPIVFVLTNALFLTLNLCGWNRLWTSRWSLEQPERRSRLILYLQPKDQTVRWHSPDIACRVRRQRVQPSEHHPVRLARGEFWTMYPDDFEPAPPLTTGRYRVTWLEENRPGKWRELVTHRATVAVPSPPPSPTPESAEQRPAPRDVGREWARMPIAITVDTSVVIGAAKGECPKARELFERAMKGELDLAVTTRLEYELTKTKPGPELAQFLKTIPVLGAPARWGVSKWGGGDTWAGSSTPNPSTDQMDSDHLEAHKASGRQVFVTCEKGRVLRWAKERGITALSPTQLLEKLDNPSKAAI